MKEMTNNSEKIKRFNERTIKKPLALRKKLLNETYRIEHLRVLQPPKSSVLNSEIVLVDATKCEIEQSKKNRKYYMLYAFVCIWKHLCKVVL